MEKLTRFLVYGLTDPRSGEIRYVGKSSSGLSRPRAHRSSTSLAAEKSHKNAWIKALHDKGLNYGIVVLAVCGPANLDDYERFWITTGLQMGWPLTNTRLDEIRREQLAEIDEQIRQAVKAGFRAVSADVIREFRAEAMAGA